MNDDKPQRQKPTQRDQVFNSQLALVEHALLSWLEEILGRVPSDEEIINLGHHYQFADTPLSVYEKEGFRFVRYFVWAGKECVALGFLKPLEPLALQIVRVKPEDWPAALRLAVENGGRE